MKKKKTTNRNIVILLITVYPIGVILMWLITTWQKKVKLLLSIPLLLFITTVIVWRSWVYPSQISGDAMSPTLRNNQYFLVDRVKSHQPLSRSDIVIFHKDGIDFISRVVGIPNDSIELTNNQLLINNQVMSDISPRTDRTFLLRDLTKTNKRIPDDSYFVMGDNKIISRDSRDFGYVNKSELLGVVAHIFPCTGRPNLIEKYNTFMVRTYPPQDIFCKPI